MQLTPAFSDERRLGAVEPSPGEDHPAPSAASTAIMARMPPLCEGPPGKRLEVNRTVLWRRTAPGSGASTLRRRPLLTASPA
jgi:hypothetical protein